MMDDRPPEHGASVDDGLPEDTWREWNCFIKATATSYSSDDIFSILLLFYDVYALYAIFITSWFNLWLHQMMMLGGPIISIIYERSGALFVIAGASLLVIVGITAKRTFVDRERGKAVNDENLIVKMRTHFLA